MSSRQFFYVKSTAIKCICTRNIYTNMLLSNNPFSDGVYVRNIYNVYVCIRNIYMDVCVRIPFNNPFCRVTITITTNRKPPL